MPEARWSNPSYRYKWIALQIISPRHRPISVSFIRRVNENRLTDEQCEKIYNRSVRLETDFVQYFSSIVAGDGFEDVYDKVKHLIKTHSTNKIWVPANEMF